MYIFEYNIELYRLGGDNNNEFFENAHCNYVKSVKLMNCKNEDLINNKNIKEKIKEVWKDYDFDNIDYFYNINDSE